MPKDSKYHHLVPQTYYSAWANSSGTLQVLQKLHGTSEARGQILRRATGNGLFAGTFLYGITELQKHQEHP